MTNSCKRGLLAVSLTVLLASAAQAADLDLPNAPPQNAPVVIDATDGWYLRGDVGLGKETKVQVVKGTSGFTSDSTYDVGGGVGYRFNSWFRTDLDFDYGKTQTMSSRGSKTIICPYTLTGLTDQATTYKVGYAWTNQVGTCRSRDTAKIDQADLLLNGYADLGTWWNVTPYVGAGVGVARVATNESGNYYKTSNGSVYNADLSLSNEPGYPVLWTDASGNTLTPQPVVPGKGTPVAFDKQNWAYSVNRVKYNFAWALMGGFGYALTPNATIDVGYRYLNRGTFKSLPASDGSTISKTLDTQEVRIGLRYQID